MPDYTKKVVLVVDITGFPADVRVDHIKIKGVALKDPTFAECIPTSIENDALAYDAVNDRFKVDIKAITATGDLATQTTLASLNNKIPSDPAKESGKLTDIYNRLPSDMAKESGKLADIETNTDNIGTPLQNTKIANVIPQETTTNEPKISINKDNVGLAKETGGNIASIKTNTDKIPSDPAKESGKLTTIDSTLTSIKGTDGIKKITDDVNVKTSGAANIIVDLLTQNAYTENRRNIANPTLATPSTFWTSGYRGKYFPRGCRGYLIRIQIRARNTTGGDLTMNFGISPHIGGSDVITFTVTIPAGADGSTNILAEIQKFWGYDSLFIYAKTACTASLGIGYDSTTPYDANLSTDLQAWSATNARPYIAAVMMGQTVGDILGFVTINRLPVKQSGVLTGDTAVKASSGLVHWITCEAGAAASVFQLNDSTNNTGTDKWQCKVPANDTRHFKLDPPLPFFTGIYFDADANIGSCTIGYT